MNFVYLSPPLILLSPRTGPAGPAEAGPTEAVEAEEAGCTAGVG